MHRYSNRALPAALAVFSCVLAAGSMTLPGQSSRRTLPAPGQPGQPVQPFIPARPPVIPARPTVVPARPTVVTPAQPRVTYPTQPSVTKQGIPGITYPVTKPTPPVTTLPAKPGLPPPSQKVKPVKPPTKPVPYPPHHPQYPYYPQYPIVVVPSYPSAYIGPEEVRITTYPTETEVADVPAPVGGDPAALQGDAATPRLVAILGRIERVEASLPAGASKPASPSVGDGDRLCIGVATLAAYYNPDPEQPMEAMARGTYFGSRWDGDAWHTSATGLWSRGPVTQQPIFTLHEVQPGDFPFEVAVPGRRITSLRMAVALVRDAAASATGPSAQPSRHRVMADRLRHHLQETDEPVPLVPPQDPAAPAPSAEPDPEATYLGQAHSPFGQALANSLQDVLATASLPQPSPAAVSGAGAELLGVAEYVLPLSDLRDILGGCPRFTTIPLPADLLTVRARDTSPGPLWVRPFRLESEDGAVVYQGEVWFLIVPDGAMGGRGKG